MPCEHGSRLVEKKSIMCSLPSDDDLMVAGVIESHARRKASERATRTHARRKDPDEHVSPGEQAFRLAQVLKLYHEQRFHLTIYPKQIFSHSIFWPSIFC
jgi:phosphatidylserine decarboxylase